MAININGSNATNDDGYLGKVVLSDTDEAGTSAAKNMVVLSQASYDALTPDSSTLYFISDLEDDFDSDAITYIRAVEAADDSYLESGVKVAYDTFIKGLKTASLWNDVISSSCILQGAKTLAGALVPLKGTAPTPYNVSEDDYSRTTGLVGVPANTSYIDTQFDMTSVPTNDNHMLVRVTSLATVNSLYCGVHRYNDPYTATFIQQYNGNAYCYNRARSGQYVLMPNVATGTLMTYRNTSPDARYAVNSTMGAGARSSNDPNTTSVNAYVLASNGSAGAGSFSNARFTYYSMGYAFDSTSQYQTYHSLLTSLSSAIVAAI